MEKITNFISNCGNKLARRSSSQARQEPQQRYSEQNGVGSKRTYGMANFDAEDF